MKNINWNIAVLLPITIVLFYFVSNLFDSSLTLEIYLENVVNILLIACILKNTLDIQKL